jgi:hypothetical protein
MTAFMGAAWYSAERHLVFSNRDSFKVSRCVVQEDGKIIERRIEMDEREIRGARLPSYTGGVRRCCVSIRTDRCSRRGPCFVQQVNYAIRKV